MNNPLVHRLRPFGTTIFSEMTQLALRHNAINLGQGFPDTDGPAEVLEAARAAISAGHNQYPPGWGIAPLREAVAYHQKRCYDLDLDPERQVMASAGATEAMTAAILALCEPGAEVIALEPSYDCYVGAVALAGGKFVPVRLHAPAYRLDPAELEAAVTERTRLIIVNSPHNPTGHVLDARELDAIAEVARRHDLIVLTDEVYEHLVFDGHAHIPMASLPGMFERTLTISSGGKTFSTTGWKIGWLSGPEELLRAVQISKQNMTYASGTPLQHAIAVGLRLPAEHFQRLQENYQQARDRLVAGLSQAGLTVHPSMGTYFVVADISGITDEDGDTFCRALPERIGVAAVPNQVFYADPDAGRQFVRFTCSKATPVLDEAIERLAGLGR